MTDTPEQKVFLGRTRVGTIALDPDDPAQAAAEALCAAGIPVTPEGEEMEHWRVGAFVMSDEALIRLAESRGLVAGETVQ